jgi:hypothetical protein
VLATFAQLLGNWILNNFAPFTLGTQAGFLCIQNNWSFLMWHFSCLADLLHRYTFHRIVGFCLSFDDTCHHVVSSGPLLHFHHQSHSKISICSAKNKGLFHLFLTHGCHLHYLWELCLCVHETICKGKGDIC